MFPERSPQRLLAGACASIAPLLLALCAWPVARQLDALNLLSYAEDWSALALEGGALLALLGASLGVASLGRYRGLLERSSPGRRLVQEASFLMLLLAGVQLVALDRDSAQADAAALAAPPSIVLRRLRSRRVQMTNSLPC